MANTTRVVMPQLGESVHEGTISKWLVKPGDKVVEFEPMLEVDTDKVNAEVPAPVTGILREILAKEGETVQAGAEIAVVEIGGTDGNVSAKPEAPAPPAAAATTVAKGPEEATQPAAVQPAEKARKQETVAFLNDAIRTGRFKAKSASKFAQDCNLVEIDKSKSRPDKIAVSDKYHSDIIDAVIYAFKLSPAYAFQVPAPKAKVGTPEWSKAEEERMFESELAYFQELAESSRRYNGDFS